MYEARQRARQQVLADVKRQNRLSMWGLAFNLREIVPAGSLADNYLGAAEEAVAAAQLQGQLNVVNGLTNILVEGFNTSMYVMFGVPTTALTNFVNTAAGEAVLPTEFPQIPVIDHSQDAFVFEDPYWHGWSVWCAGTGITMLLPGGIAKQAGPALKGTSIGRMFTGVSKSQSGAVEAVVSQAKSLTPKVGKVRLPRSTARAGQVVEAIKGTPRIGAASRAKGYGDWFPFWNDRGGETFAWAVKDRKFLGPKYLPGVRNFDRPGTLAHLDTAAHEGVHAFVIKHLPSIHDAGRLRIGNVPVGAPLKYLEEVVAYGVGHLRAGRIHGVPFNVIEPLLSSSLTNGEKAVTIFTMLVGGWGIYEYNN